MVGEYARDILIDHCSITWGVDENVAFSGPRDQGPDKTAGNIIIRNSIIAEALNDSSHPEGPHSKGMLVHNNVQNISVINNLFAHNTRRNPYFKSNTRGIIKGNIIYNPGKRAIHLSSKKSAADYPYPEVSIVSNILIHGENTAPDVNLISKYGVIYEFDNHVDARDAGLSDGMARLLEKPVIQQSGLDLLDANIKNDFCKVLSQVGARPWDPSDIDTRIKMSVLNRDGHIIDSQSDVGGYPNYQANQRKFEKVNSEIISLCGSAEQRR